MRKIIILLFIFTFVAFHSFGESSINSEKGFNVAGTLSIYGYSDLPYDPGISVKLIGMSLNFNFALYLKQLEQLKFQPYISVSLLTFTRGTLFTGVLTEYLFRDHINIKNLSPSLGLDVRMITTEASIKGYLVGVPLTTKYFVTQKLAISGLIEPTMWFSTEPEENDESLDQKNVFSVRVQTGVHYFFF